MPTTLVLSDDVDRGAIDAALLSAGLSLVNVVSESPSHPHQLITVGDEVQATFITDARLGLRWVVIDGARSRPVREALATCLACLGWEEIEARAGSPDPEEQVWALTRSVGFLEPERSARLFARALGSGERRVRAAALLAAAYLPCPGMSALLQEHAMKETDPELASLAQGFAKAGAG